MQSVAVVVVGDGPFAARVRERAPEHAVDVATDRSQAAVAIVTDGATAPTGVPAIAAPLRQGDVAPGVDVAVGGAWGGLGSLLGAVAAAEADDPRELHVAYGFPGATRLLRRLGSAVRPDVLRVATDEAVARVDGQIVPEPFAGGRRLAWFPRPVGPAHAVAVGGLDHLALLPVPTIRTWIAARSLTAEALQALGRTSPESGVGRWIDQRAGRGSDEARTADVRWAAVAECRDHDGSVIRAWANGTDPLLVTADLLLVGARRLVTDGPGPGPTIADLAPPTEVLNALADLRTLRWSVSRPEPSQR